MCTIARFCDLRVEKAWRYPEAIRRVFGGCSHAQQVRASGQLMWLMLMLTLVGVGMVLAGPRPAAFYDSVAIFFYSLFIAPP